MPGGIRGTRPEKPLVCHERDVRPGAWPAGVMEWHGYAGAGPHATPVRLANGRVGRMTPPGDAVQCLAELHARCIREPCHTRLQDRVCAYQDAYFPSRSLSLPRPIWASEGQQLHMMQVCNEPPTDASLERLRNLERLVVNRFLCPAAALEQDGTYMRTT